MAKKDRDAVKSGLGQVFSPGGTDILSSVIESDRRRTHRGEVPSDASIEHPIELPAPSESQIPIEAYTSHTTTPAENITSSITAQAVISEAAKEGGKRPAKTPSKTDTQAGIQHPAKAVSSEASKEAAQELAQKLAASKAMPITLRLPEALNDWLDEYAHAHRKEGVKKQDLISRAVQLLVIELEE